jgi:hypothetical protein
MTGPRLLILLALLVISCGCGEREVAAPPKENTEKAVSVSQEPRVHYPKGMSQEEIEDLKRLEAETKVKQQQYFEADLLSEETQKALIKLRDEALGRGKEYYFKFDMAVSKLRYESWSNHGALENSNEEGLENLRFEHQEVVGKTLDQFVEKWYDPSLVLHLSPEELDAYLRSMRIIAGPGIIPRPGEPGYTPANTPKAQ